MAVLLPENQSIKWFVNTRPSSWADSELWKNKKEGHTCLSRRITDFKRWWFVRELKSGRFTELLDCAIAQAVSRCLPTAAARVRALVRSHVGFVVDKLALGDVFSEYFGFLCQNLFHQLLHNHHHLSSGAGTVGHHSTKWTQSHPTKNNNNKVILIYLAHTEVASPHSFW
jgi:hypothetical protein